MSQPPRSQRHVRQHTRSTAPVLEARAASFRATCSAQLQGGIQEDHQRREMAKFCFCGYLSGFERRPRSTRSRQRSRPRASRLRQCVCVPRRICLCFVHSRKKWMDSEQRIHWQRRVTLAAATKMITLQWLTGGAPAPADSTLVAGDGCRMVKLEKLWDVDRCLRVVARSLAPKTILVGSWTRGDRKACEGQRVLHAFDGEQETSPWTVRKRL